ALVLAVLAGLLTAHWRFATEGYWRNPRLIGKVALTIGIGAVASYGAQQATKDWKESQWLERARKIETYTDEKKSALMHAWESAPDNHRTAYEIGECLRLQSWSGETGNEQLAKEAMKWFERAMALDPYDPYTPMRYGMCLDWLD